MICKLLLAGWPCCLSATAARAAWHEATSNNFIVYSEGSAQDAREFAAKLERFHYVLRTFHRISAATMPGSGCGSSSCPARARSAAGRRAASPAIMCRMRAA